MSCVIGQVKFDGIGAASAIVKSFLRTSIKSFVPVRPFSSEVRVGYLQL